MRICRYCNGESGDESNFCWHCARELDARPERPAEIAERSDHTLLWVGVIGLVVVVLLLLQNF